MAFDSDPKHELASRTHNTINEQIETKTTGSNWNWMNFKWKKSSDVPSEVYNWKLYLSTLAFGCLGTIRGYDIGNIAGAKSQVSFKTQFGLNDPTKTTKQKSDIASNIASMVQLGGIGGTILSIFLLDKLGRKKTLQFICVAYFITVTIQITSKTVGQLYAGRLLEGIFADGITTTVGPTYMSEVTPKTIRGRFNCVYAGLIYVGGTLGYFINYGTALHIANLSNVQWIAPTSVKLIIAGLILISSVFFSIESPRWLIKMGRYVEGKDSLVKLRQLPIEHPFIKDELQMIHTHVEIENNYGSSKLSLMKQLFTVKSIRYRFFNVCALMQCLGHWSGSNALGIYTPKLLSYSGITGTNRLKLTGILGVVKVFAAYLCGLIDIGRRASLFVGISIQLVLMLYFAIFVQIVPQAADPNITLTPSQFAASKAAIAAIYMSGIGWVTGFNLLQYFIGSEVFPLHIRSFAQSLVMCIHFINQYANTKAVPSMLIYLKPNGTFYFFTAINALSLVWAYFSIPELNGRSLENMEEVFNLPWHLVRRSVKLVPIE